MKLFEEISLGSEKDDVLEKIGNPTFTDRKDGQDRWTYQIYDENIRHDKVIHFLDGFVTYKGEPLPPFLSAEEQDQINFNKNIILNNNEQNQKSKQPDVKVLQPPTQSQ